MKGRLFAKIVYFLLTFSIGILIALFLPYMLYADSSDAIYVVGDLLDSGDYVAAMKMAGGYFDEEPAISEKFGNGGGIVLYRAATLVEAESSDDEEIGDKLHKAYSGFIFGTDGYKITATENNKAKIVLTDANGSHDILILNQDLTDDGVADTNSVYYQRGFMYVDFGIEDYQTLTGLTLIDCNGETYAEISFELDFSEAFFGDVETLIEKYNAYVDEYARDHSETNEQTLTEMEAELESLEQEFFAKDSSYTRSSSSIDDALIRSQSNKKAVIVVVVYFVCVYVVADFMFGYHYILRFARWFGVKVLKIKPKKKTKAKANNEAFGHDYFCKITFVLDTSQTPDFNSSVQIRYSNQTSEVKFELMKENGYTAVQSVKAGTYVNLWVDVDSAYTVIDLPETLEADGFQKGYKVKIIKREEQSL